MLHSTILVAQPSIPLSLPLHPFLTPMIHSITCASLLRFPLTTPLCRPPEGLWAYPLPARGPLSSTMEARCCTRKRWARRTSSTSFEWLPHSGDCMRRSLPVTSSYLSSRRSVFVEHLSPVSRCLSFDCSHLPAFIPAANPTLSPISILPAIGLPPSLTMSPTLHFSLSSLSILLPFFLSTSTSSKQRVP